MIEHATLPDLDTLDLAALKVLILNQHEKLLARDSEIEHLKLLIAKLRRQQFGRKSEKVERQIEQLELRLGELEASRAEREVRQNAVGAKPEAARPVRRALPVHLPREERRVLPAENKCPDCGGELKHLGEDVSEILERVPEHFRVIRQVRPKLACCGCDKIVQAEAPSRPIAGSFAGPGLLAHVLISKYCDHAPLYRQEEIYAREGVELDRSTLAGWVGATSQLIEPLVEALRRHVMSAEKLHADDTPIPVLAPGNGKPRSVDCGPMCETIGRRGICLLRRCGLLTRRTARESIRKDTWLRSAGPCRRMPIRATTECMRTAGFAMPDAWPMCGASSTICWKHTNRL